MTEQERFVAYVKEKAIQYLTDWGCPPAEQADALDDMAAELAVEAGDVRARMREAAEATEPAGEEA